MQIGMLLYIFILKVQGNFFTTEDNLMAKASSAETALAVASGPAGMAAALGSKAIRGTARNVQRLVTGGNAGRAFVGITAGIVLGVGHNMLTTSVETTGKTAVTAMGKGKVLDAYVLKDPPTCFGVYDTSVTGTTAVWTGEIKWKNFIHDISSRDFGIEPTVQGKSNSKLHFRTVACLKGAETTADMKQNPTSHEVNVNIHEGNSLVLFTSRTNVTEGIDVINTGFSSHVLEAGGALLGGFIKKLGKVESDVQGKVRGTIENMGRYVAEQGCSREAIPKLANGIAKAEQAELFKENPFHDPKITSPSQYIVNMIPPAINYNVPSLTSDDFKSFEASAKKNGISFTLPKPSELDCGGGTGAPVGIPTNAAAAGIEGH